MRDHSNDVRTIDELDLTIETLKDLTPSSAQADLVRGGNTAKARFACECGSA